MSEFKPHIDELRSRLIQILSVLMIIFAIAFYFSNILFHTLSTPLLKYLPQGSGLIATDITSPFIVPIRLALFVAIVLSLPCIFYHIWSFIAPGLYKEEKTMIFPLTFMSLGLFLIGMSFCYFVVFPLLFQVFISLVPKDITIMTDMANYLDFCLNTLLIFGATFQIPIVIIFLTKINLISTNWLKEKRPHFVVLALIISMLLTPPDAISMLLLAVPVCGLYEFGLFFTRFIKN